MVTRIGRAPAAAGLLLALLATACSGAAPAAPPTPAATPRGREIPVKVAVVTRADLASTLAYTGDVKAKSALNVVPKATGRIEKLPVDLGSTVQVGDVIAELDREQAELAVRQADANRTAARSKLAQLQAGARPEAVAQAEANARAARARVAALQQSGRPEQVAQALANLDSARQRLEALKHPRSEQVGQAEANVKAAEARLEALKKGATSEQVRAAEIAVEQAKNALYGVQVQKDAACGRGGGFQCDAAQAQALASEQAVKQAQQQLKILTAPPTDEAVAQAQAAVDAAREQANLARHPASPQDVAMAENQVRQAEAAVQLARNPVLASDLEAARAQAEASEAAARLAAQPYTKHDLEAAEASVDAAEAQLELARTQLKELTVVSPVAGVVSERFLVPGSIASPSTPIVAIASPEVEITFSVEESQLGRIQPGQPAKISLAALPGEPLSGRVQLIAPTLDTRTRTAQVKVAPDAAALGKLRPGMFAQVTVESERKQAALVVPRSAILPDGQPGVFVVDGGVARRVAVKLGTQERDRVEVVEGLKEGDQVVLDAVDLRDGDRVAVAADR
ncbi:MAG TPA: efflux RND transporter periplasmic adaptor subunit [Chloroflexota bacterium]|jgi:HlyD family secretion protein|nr:efflux RND transporter periplasmic adaptor subunit [Chloroflexota bacterium]